MSRTQRILAWLIANPAGGKFRELLEAIEPDCKRTIFAAQVQQLCRVKKIVATGAPRHQVYTAGPKALIDGRTAANAAKKGKRRTAKPVGRAASPGAAAPQSSGRPADATTAKPRMRMDTIARRRLAPAGIRRGTAETVDQFIARGGRVERLAMGAVSQPLTYIGHRAVNEASWRDRVGE